MLNFLSTYWIWILFAGAMLSMHLGHGASQKDGHGGGCGGGHARQHEDDQHEHTQREHGQHDSPAGTLATAPRISLSKVSRNGIATPTDKD